LTAAVVHTVDKCDIKLVGMIGEVGGAGHACMS
jgi:hypothetical protein